MPHIPIRTWLVVFLRDGVYQRLLTTDAKQRPTKNALAACNEGETFEIEDVTGKTPAQIEARVQFYRSRASQEKEPQKQREEGKAL